MINSLIRFSVEQRFLVLMLVALLAGLGVYSLQSLPIDAMPDVTNVQVQILTTSPALPPLDVERQITYVPAALTFALRAPLAETESGLIGYARRRYEPLLAYVMRRRGQALAVAVALVAASGALFPFLGTEFVPRLDEGSLALESRLLPSVSLSQSIKTYSDAERVLRRFPEVTRVVSKIGRAEVATDPMGVESADIFVDLKP
ncbi:MAG: efflux RND transporter permease subunit, partial [Burkholderiales bacterium]